MITRRNTLLGLLATPAIIRTPGLLMPIKPIRLLDGREVIGQMLRITIDGNGELIALVRMCATGKTVTQVISWKPSVGWLEQVQQRHKQKAWIKK